LDDEKGAQFPGFLREAGNVRLQQQQRFEPGELRPLEVKTPKWAQQFLLEN
jgi:hypothetical protein